MRVMDIGLRVEAKEVFQKEGVLKKIFNKAQHFDRF